jgi:hypothetical protein
MDVGAPPVPPDELFRDVRILTNNCRSVSLGSGVVPEEYFSDIESKKVDQL